MEKLGKGLLIIIGLMIIATLYALFYFNGDFGQTEREVLIQEEGKYDLSNAYQKIRDYLHEINGNGYSIISIDIHNQHILTDSLIQVYTDVIMEKEDLYDWLRLKVVLDGDILSIERVNIPYYERVSQVDRLPLEAEVAIQKALESISLEERDWFGINLRSFQIGSNGIQNVKVTNISAIAANEDLTEVLAKASLKITLLDQVKEGEHFVYLRKYEHKWQVEDIKVTKGGL